MGSEMVVFLLALNILNPIFRVFCVRFFWKHIVLFGATTAVMKHHNQSNLERKGLFYSQFLVTVYHQRK